MRTKLPHFSELSMKHINSQPHRTNHPNLWYRKLARVTCWVSKKLCRSSRTCWQSTVSPPTGNGKMLTVWCNQIILRGSMCIGRWQSVAKPLLTTKTNWGWENVKSTVSIRRKLGAISFKCLRRIGINWITWVSTFNLRKRSPVILGSRLVKIKTVRTYFRTL